MGCRSCPCGGGLLGGRWCIRGAIGFRLHGLTRGRASWGLLWMAVRAHPCDGLELLRAFLGFNGGRCRFGGGITFILGVLCKHNRSDIMHTCSTVVSRQVWRWQSRVRMVTKNGGDGGAANSPLLGCVAKAGAGDALPAASAISRPPRKSSRRLLQEEAATVSVESLGVDVAQGVARIGEWLVSGRKHSICPEMRRARCRVPTSSLTTFPD